MCPPSRSPASSAGSRFTESPGARSPRVVRCRVGAIRSTQKRAGSAGAALPDASRGQVPGGSAPLPGASRSLAPGTSRALLPGLPRNPLPAESNDVILTHTPSTAMESPSVVCGGKSPVSTKRAPSAVGSSAWTVPIAVTSPVTIGSPSVRCGGQVAVALVGVNRVALAPAGVVRVAVAGPGAGSQAQVLTEAVHLGQFQPVGAGDRGHARVRERGRARTQQRRGQVGDHLIDRKSTRLNSSHVSISYAVFCLKKKTRARNRNP